MASMRYWCPRDKCSTVQTIELEMYKQYALFVLPPITHLNIYRHNSWNLL